MKSKHKEKELQALQIINRVISGMDPALNAKKTISHLRYREDYQDYYLVFSDKTGCGIREKLIAEIMKVQTAAGSALTKAALAVLSDISKDIQFRISHAAPVEEGENQEAEPEFHDEDPII